MTNDGSEICAVSSTVGTVQSAAVVVVQRQTVDWAGMSLAAFHVQSRAFCRLWGKPEDYVWQLRELWDSTFALGYLQTRSALKTIADAQTRRAANICFAPYDDYRNLPQLDAPYLFLDDDDWIAPDIALARAQFDYQPANAWLWRTVSVGSPQQEYPVFVWGLNGRCMTNNYAVSGRWLWSCVGHLQQVVQHASAAQTLALMQNVPQLDIAITATNKSPCSSVSLDRGLQGDLQPARLIALVESFLQKMARLKPEDIHAAPWVAEPLRETVALFERVYDSRYGAVR